MINEGGRTYCIDPLADTLGLISRRWALLVIGILGNRKATRFTEARRTIPGITARALSAVLQDLVGAGLARRDVDAARSPPAVSYGLTGRGRRLRQALIPLLEWSEADTSA